MPMTPKKQRRLAFAIALLLAGAARRRSSSMRCRTTFCSSTAPATSPAIRRRRARTFRIGGLVEQGSVKRDQRPRSAISSSPTARTRCRCIIRACCPICSAKGRAWWRWAAREPDGVFKASEVLAKHDERYMPPEVVDALKRSGHWQEGEAAPRRPASLMTGEIGQLALCLALALSLVQAVAGFAGAARAMPRRHGDGRAARRSASSSSSRSPSAR